MPTDPSDGVLVRGMIGAYVHAPGPVDVNNFTATDPGANQVTVDWIESRGRYPEVVLVAFASVRENGGYERLRRGDPLVDWAHDRYGAPVADPPFLRFAPGQMAPAADDASVQAEVDRWDGAAAGRCPVPQPGSPAP